MRHTVNLSMARRLLAALCLVLVAAGASAQFSGSGSGTKDDPYRIYNAAQLNQVRNFLNDTSVVFSLEADIDMTDWIADNNPVQGCRLSVVVNIHFAEHSMATDTLSQIYG